MKVRGRGPGLVERKARDGEGGKNEEGGEEGGNGENGEQFVIMADNSRRGERRAKIRMKWFYRW